MDEALLITDLLGSETEVRQFQISTARNTVLVVPFSDGGIISYKRHDGTCLHTLNNKDGFNRKLSDLNIKL